MLMFATVARNEEPYIAEWIAFHLLQGVDSFLIFDNASDDRTPEVARQFSGKYEVIVVPWPTPDGSNFIPVQTAAYNVALAMAVGRGFDWLMFTDIDEFTFGEGGTTLPEHLGSLPEDVGAVAVRPYEFGSNHRLSRPSKGLVIENFRRSISNSFASRAGYVKSFGRPHAVMGMKDTPHSLQVAEGFRYVYPDGAPVTHNDVRHGIAEDPHYGGIMQHHYVTKSLEEFRIKKARYIGKTRKFDENFFANRDAVYNAADRPSLVTMGDSVRRKMAEVGL